MSKENMTIEIDSRDIEEIENNFDDLGKWLTEHFTRFGAQAVVLSAIIEKVEELKKELTKGGTFNVQGLGCPRRLSWRFHMA